MSSQRPAGESTPQVPSLFDPFLVEFLRALQTLPDGFSTQSSLKPLAGTLQQDPAFIEALFTCARRRSLIEAYYPPGRRSAFRWRVSRRGEHFMNAHIAAIK
jgi:hypothetical protein